MSLVEEPEDMAEVAAKLTVWPITASNASSSLGSLPKELVDRLGPAEVLDIVDDMIGRISVGQSRKYLRGKFTRVMYTLSGEDFDLLYRVAKDLVGKFRS